jgi:hypothetical protein
MNQVYVPGKAAHEQLTKQLKIFFSDINQLKKSCFYIDVPYITMLIS